MLDKRLGHRATAGGVEGKLRKTKWNKCDFLEGKEVSVSWCLEVQLTEIQSCLASEEENNRLKRTNIMK